MDFIEPEPPARTITLKFDIPEIGLFPESLTTAFAYCSAEAQMLEHSIKSAITKDVDVFAKAEDQISLLEVLEKITLGNAKNIMAGTSNRKDHKDIVACVGFFDFVKMQWGFTGRPESELNSVLKDVVERRNRLAHQLLAEVFHSVISVENALVFLEESKKRFFEVRSLIILADGLSSKFGSVASDGSSLPRFKTTS